MVLEDWKLMRTRRLKQLDEAIHSYRQHNSEQGEEGLTPEEAKARWKREAELIARIHDAVHQLRDALGTDIFLAHEVAGSPLRGVPKLALEKPADVFADFRTIRSSLPGGIRKMSAKRSADALLVVDELITYVAKQLKEMRAAAQDKSGGNRGEGEARALFEFLVLVGHYHDRSIANPQTHDFAEEIWKMLENRDDVLCRELKDMKPPLTWGETLYHFLLDLEAHRGDPDADRQRKRVAQYLFPVREFYCLDCDRPFAVDNRHPGRFVCPRCQAKGRKRRKHSNLVG
jgi:hypothetical protein